VIDPFATYKRAIVAAAVKRPDYQRTLTAIESTGPALRVATFRTPRELTPEVLAKRDFDIWVSLSDEIRQACTGAPNPARKIQEVFGLPPAAAKSKVMTEFEVPRDGLIRPCVAGGDLASTRCEIDFTKLSTDEADPAKLKDDYDRLKLVARQMWDSYRIGFARDGVSPSDYPYTGFPFTGMGWSYNWSSQSPSHFGVSEFVIKRGVPIKIVSEKTPADFCRAALNGGTGNRDRKAD
jgi:hypothetical protein